MKITSPDGKEYKIPIYQYLLGKSNKELSGPAQRCIELIRELFPLDPICIEVPLPKKGGGKLFLDVFLPNKNLAIEVHGKQHSAYVKHFHSSYDGFINAVNRDSYKAELLSLNGITLITLYDGAKNWREQLQNWMLI